MPNKFTDFSFDDAPDNALVSLKTGSAILGGRSRCSLYRDIAAGRLTLVKIGSSSRLRVGDLRKLIGAVQGEAK